MKIWTPNSRIFKKYTMEEILTPFYISSRMNSSHEAPHDESPYAVYKIMFYKPIFLYGLYFMILYTAPI